MKLPFDFRTLQRISISACGTAFYAGMVAKYWFERFARIPVEVDIASEFRYRSAPLREGDLSIFVSQSGETADTLASLRYAHENKQHVLSVVNVPTSTIARESHVVMPTLAGPEIGVASTKAFTCQLAALAVLAIAAGRARGVLSEDDERKLVHALIEVPRHLSETLALEPQIEQLARDLAKSRDVLYLGRGTSYPIALEGALKLKEISYIHAQARPDRADRRIHAGDRDCAVRQGVRENRFEHAGSRGARRADDPGDRCQGRARSHGRIARHADPARHAGNSDAAGLCRPGATHGLPYGRHHGHGRRSAAKSCKIRDSGIDAAACCRARRSPEGACVPI
jgi:DNA-binding MurR/RpiR family transcriptional regulator